MLQVQRITSVLGAFRFARFTSVTEVSPLVLLVCMTTSNTVESLIFARVLLHEAA